MTDNVTAPVSGTTFKSKDLGGGLQLMGHALYDEGGNLVLSAAQVVSLLGYLDGVEGKLDTLHTDLATTLAAYVDGLETLVGATNTALGGTLATAGNVAHDAADSGNPVKVGHKATTSLSGVTLVSSGDRADSLSGVDGVPIVRPHTNLEDIVSGNASNTDGSSTQCIASSGAGVKTYLTSVVITNTSASNIYVEIKDGSTTKITLPVPANSGVIFNPPVPVPGTAATAWNFDPSAATTTVYCSMVGFKSKV